MDAEHDSNRGEMNGDGAKPFTNGGGQGRAANGRFTVGNPGGPGNPHIKRVSHLRAMLMAAVTDEDLQAIARMLIDKAKDGDMPAIRELLDRTIGKPAQTDLLERIEALEAIISNYNNSVKTSSTPS